jgi:26S proteasome regulatory subunit T1
MWKVHSCQDVFEQTFESPDIFLVTIRRFARHNFFDMDDDEDKEEPKALDEADISILTTYSRSPFAKEISETEAKIDELRKHVEALKGIHETNDGLLPVADWQLQNDRTAFESRTVEHAAQMVGQIEKILPPQNNTPQRYVFNVPQYAKFVVELTKQLSPTDVSEGMRVSVVGKDMEIATPLPPRIDPLVSAMQVEDRPDVTYSDVGGCKEQLLQLREIIELPLLHPEAYSNLGIDPPKGVLFFGPPGTGKTLLARAVANRTDATFIRVLGSELVQKYIGEGARMVREIFKIARSKPSAIIFFDEVDAFGMSRTGGDEEDGANSEVQRTMLELIQQLDGFDARGNVKVLMATNRPDTLDPALIRPGRLDRKVEFGLPDLEGRVQIFKIHARTMNVEKGVRYELLARLCPNSTGADLRSVCTEAGIIALRTRRKAICEKDFLDAVNKVIKGYAKFSATPTYMHYN